MLSVQCEPDKEAKVSRDLIPSRSPLTSPLRRVFVPNLAHSFAVTNASTAAETDRRDKRARRFEDDSSPSSSNGNDAGDRKLHKSSSGLNARLHQVMSAGGSRSTPEPEGVYDPVSLNLSSDGMGLTLLPRMYSTGIIRLLWGLAHDSRSPSCD
jgi:hypothetical protein